MASRNVRTSIEKDELVIRVKLDAASIKAAKPSSSGKSRVIGTTGGIKDVDGSAIEGLQMGLNVTIPAD